MEALGQLTGGIAHDFGNVLQVISGRLRMLEKRPEDKRLLTSAREAASRGEKAVQSMLAFARRQPLRPEVFDLNNALAGIDSLLRQAVGSAIQVSMDLAAVPCRIKVDRNQMELAILNLAINARDAMPDGGRLIVTLNTERLNGSPDGLVGGYAVIAIEDTGTGMPPEVQAQALEPFFTTKEPGKGTGLGLSMVYGFSKQSGGALTIESEVGRGTSISIFLPISEAECDRAATALSEHA
jgi:signal transduction histidine kinase